ncbi:hypothetical protein C8R43DRAFT_337816 [Mycena crocata]|nr:hypothetical protein C8R43DRAFT_337816 [Mycena crocata]
MFCRSSRAKTTVIVGSTVGAVVGALLAALTVFLFVRKVQKLSRNPSKSSSFFPRRRRFTEESFGGSESRASYASLTRTPSVTFGPSDTDVEQGANMREVLDALDLGGSMLQVQTPMVLPSLPMPDSTGTNSRASSMLLPSASGPFLRTEDRALSVTVVAASEDQAESCVGSIEGSWSPARSVSEKRLSLTCVE